MNSLSSLSSELYYKIFYNLSLKDLQNISCTCRLLSGLLNEESFWNSYLPTLVPNNASYRFLEKLGSKLTMKQLLVINFNDNPKQVELMKNPKEEKVNILCKLIFSVRAMEKFTQEEGWEKYNSQRSYAHLLFCWGDHGSAIDMDRMKRSAKNEMKEEWQKEQRSLMCSGTNELLSQTDEYENCCMLFSQCCFYLQVEAPEVLTTFFTEIWTHYSPTMLNPMPGMERMGDMYTFMQNESFTGFCRAVSMKKEFGTLKFWYFNNEHLSAFNSAFKECKVKCLDVCLLPDVEKEPLEAFIEVIKKKDQFLTVRVDFMAPMHEDAKNVFNAFYPVSFAYITRWEMHED